MLLAVAREGEWLAATMQGVGADLFGPVAPAAFEDPSRSARLKFVDEYGDGVAERLRVDLRGEEMWATRVEIPPGAPPVEEFVGVYYSDELEAAYGIASMPGGLVVRTPSSRPLHRADLDVVSGAIGF